MRILGSISFATALSVSSTVGHAAQNQTTTFAGFPNAILDETDPYSAAKDIVTFVDSLNPADLPNALRDVESRQGPAKAQALSILASKWTDSDPKAAILESRQPGDWLTTETIIASVYASLTRHDPENAVLEVMQMPVGGVIFDRAIDHMPSEMDRLRHTQQTVAEKRATAMTAVVKTEAEIDPAKALLIALEFQKNNLWNDGLYIVFGRWAQKNPDDATRAMLKLSPTREKDWARSIANSLVWKDPQSAIAWANKLPDGQMRLLSVQFVIMQWAQKDPMAAFRYAQALPLLHEKDEFLTQIINDWSLNDPKASVEFVDSLPASPSKDTMLQSALVAWAGGDFNAAMPRIEKIASLKERNKVLRQVLGSWVQVDLDSAMHWIQALTLSERNFAWGDALNSLSASDPALAAEWFGKIPDYPRKTDAIRNLVYFWQQKDPEAAWNWVQKLPDSDLKNEVSSGVMGVMAYVDQKAAIDHLAALPAGGFKDSCIEALAKTMADLDVKSALHLLETATPGSSRDDCLYWILTISGETDPKFATLYGNAYPWQPSVRIDGNQTISSSPMMRRGDFLKNSFASWLKHDPSAATAWFKALPDDEVKQTIFANCSRLWATTDIEGASAYALSLPPGPLHNDLVQDVAEVMADNDPARAFEWIKQLKDPSEAKQVQKHVITYLAQNDPDIAVKYVASLHDQNDRLQIMENVAPQWARNDPAAAAHWVGTFPESKEKADTLSLVAQRWLDTEPESAAKWLEQLPQSASRDAAVYGYSHRILENDHSKIALAYQWAQKIADPTQKVTLETYLFGQWLIIDPETANKVLKDSSLPEDLKAKIIKGEAN